MGYILSQASQVPNHRITSIDKDGPSGPTHGLVLLKTLQELHDFGLGLDFLRTSISSLVFGDNLAFGSLLVFDT